MDKDEIIKREESAQNILDDLIARARGAGAEFADAIMIEGISVSHALRLGALENIERSEGRDLGLRIMIGKKQAIVSSTDLSSAALDTLVERGLAMARNAPEDPYCGLADSALLFDGAVPDLEIVDAGEPAQQTLAERAATAEDAARAVSGITNSEGASADWGCTTVALATSTGFCRAYSRTTHSVGVSVLAGEGTEMERDYAFTTACFGADLEDAAALGERAGKRTVQRLHPKQVNTCTVPVMYDPRVSSSLLRHLAGAINGRAIARHTSFLQDKLGAAIFSPDITIVDDPHRTRGLRTRPFDGEGVANTRRNLVEEGVLKTWLLDTSSARQLGMQSSGHATRGISGPPSPGTTNLYLQAGKCTPEELMADIKSGFYVTDLIGASVNGLTGDYSRGASGFWIENGELTHPVSGLTIASNLNDMYAHLRAADDLEFRYGINAPTIRVDQMTVAGS